MNIFSAFLILLVCGCLIGFAPAKAQDRTRTPLYVAPSGTTVSPGVVDLYDSQVTKAAQKDQQAKEAPRSLSGFDQYYKNFMTSVADQKAAVQAAMEREKAREERQLAALSAAESSVGQNARSNGVNSNQFQSTIPVRPQIYVGPSNRR